MDSLINSLKLNVHNLVNFDNENIIKINQQTDSETPKSILLNDKLSISNQKTSISEKFLNLFKKDPEEVYIDVYTTYGNDKEVTIKGRVLEKEHFKNESNDDSTLRNIVRNIRYLESDEREDVYLDISFNNKTVTVKTNEEGLFDVNIKDFGELKEGYNNVTVKLSDKNEGKYIGDIATGTVSLQKNDSNVAFISDIDDTIQKTEVTSKWKMIKNTLFRNNKTLKDIPGMSELYKALDRKNDGRIDGDFHYVSGSPINFNDRIEGFIENNKFPKGSIDLKDFGTDKLTEQIQYKLGKIRKIFDTYPDKKFVLFGDSGEKDPEIYKQISKEYPGRVQGIYINNVTNEEKNSSRFEGVSLTNNAGEAAIDLFNKGFIDKSDLEDVKKNL